MRMGLYSKEMDKRAPLCANDMVPERGRDFDGSILRRFYFSNGIRKIFFSAFDILLI